MYICHIAPTNALRSQMFQNHAYKMAIASQVLKDGVYANFFRHATRKVILDVPTYEENPTEPFPLDKLVKAIEAICPDEVILPDVWGASVDQNIEFAINGALALPRATEKGPLGFMIVPHAKSLEEYLYCTSQMVKIPNVTVIGVGGKVAKEFNTPRGVIMEHLREQFPTFPIHFLGCPEDLLDIYSQAVRTHVRSIDTAKFVRWGMSFQHPTYGNLPKISKRSDNYFERRVSEIQLSYIGYNLSYWDKFSRKPEGV